MKLQSIAMFLFGALFLSASANAITYKQYKEIKAAGGVNWESLQSYYFGIQNGIGMLNAQLIYRHKQPVYCQPDGLALNEQNLIDLLEKYIPWTITGGEVAPPPGLMPKDDANIDSALLFALENTFPCTGKEPK